MLAPWLPCSLVGALLAALLLVRSPANGYEDTTSTISSGEQLQASAGRTLTMGAIKTDDAVIPDDYASATRTEAVAEETVQQEDDDVREKRAIITERVGDQLLSRDHHSSTRSSTREVKTSQGNTVGHGEFIQPTKTESAREAHVEVQTTEADKWVWPGSGEGQGVPRGRQLRLSGPVMNSEPTQLSTHVGNERKTNPDIQDIITGIVKLLNGNAKAAPPPMTLPSSSIGHGRPLRPIMTRINNRGPPRISDIPSSFEGNVPITTPDDIGMMPPPPPRIPPPYPFETPENSHQNPSMFNNEAPAVIPLPPQPNQVSSPFTGGGGVPIPVQVVPLNEGRPQEGHANENNRPGVQENRPNAQDDHPDLIQDSRPVMGPQNRPMHRPRPRPRPQQGNKRRPQLPLNKKPESDIVFGNKKKTEPQYVTVGQFSQDPSDDASVGVSLTLDEEDTKEDVTFTTDHPTKEELPEKPLDIGMLLNETEGRPNVTEVRPSATDVISSGVEVKPTVHITSVSLAQSNVTSSVELATTESSSKIVVTMSSSASSVNEATAVNASAGDVLRPAYGQSDVSRPGIGQGEAQPIIESSMGHGTTSLQDTTSVKPTTTLAQNEAKPQFSTGAYRPRPGIVLDDTEYKPLGSRQTIITAPHRGHVGEVFDVTVSAIQGGPASEPTGKPYIYPVEIEGVKIPGGGLGEVSVITAAEEGQHFVSIDGKRTYINLFGDSTEAVAVATPATRVQASKPTAIGAGFVEPALEPPKARPPPRPHTRRPPNQPPVRIDTCIVGDDSTCDVQQNEKCLTEHGVSSCHCRPSYSRRKHREPCRRVVSIAMSLRVDKMYDRRVTWSSKLESSDSEEYRQLQYEASRALDSAMSMTPFSDEFIGTKVSGMYAGTEPTSVYVNVTLQLEENADTSRPTVRHDIQRHLLGVIHRRNNNVGDSALWVDAPPGSISQLQDIDECTNATLHDCHASAECTNTFGSFRCTCASGTRDPWLGNAHRQGRQCETCAPEHCNNRGACRYELAGHQACTCSSGFYGTQCEIDGEVLGVAIGASVAAVIIIALTLVCLCMWSRRWSREQKTAAGLGSPVFGYMAAGGSTVKTPAMGAPPYQVSLEDRMRWAQIADVMAQANHYAPEPGNCPTRPSSAVFGYPTLQHMGHMGTMSHIGTMQHSMGTMSHAGTMGGGKMPLPPVPLPRMNIPHNMQTLNRSQAAMSTHGGYSLHGGTFNPHSGMRTPDTKQTFESSSSDEEDRTDLLGRNFHVPRPKSRSSVASGIYYDVDTDQADLYASKLHSIPMSTYTTRSNNYFMQ